MLQYVFSSDQIVAQLVYYIDILVFLRFFFYLDMIKSYIYMVDSVSCNNIHVIECVIHVPL